MSISRYILILSFCCLAYSTVLAQNFEAINDRFPISLSENFFQDSYGFLWISTVDGLMRFDGYKIVQYTHDPLDSFSIKQNDIYSISEDAKGNIWAGMTGGGANVLDRNSNKFHDVCFKDSLGICIKTLGVSDFQLDNDQMWVATSEGLFNFSTDPPYISRSRFISSKDDSLSISNNRVRNLFIDSKQQFWVGARDGINLFDRSSNTFINYKTNTGFPKGQIRDIDEGPQGHIWICTRFVESFLFRWEENEMSFTPALVELYPILTDRLHISWDHDQNMWITAQGKGELKINSKTGEKEFFDPIDAVYHGFSNFYGHNMLTDSYGNIWVSGGRVLRRPGSKKIIHHISGNAHSITSVYADSNSIWYSSIKPYRWSREHKVNEAYFPKNYPTNIRANGGDKEQLSRIYKVIEYGADHLIFITTRSIFLWDKRDDSFKEYPANIGGPFRDFVYKPETNSILICPNQYHPAQFNLTTEVLDRPIPYQQVKGAHAVEIGPEGDVWFGSSYQGLYRFDSKTDSLTRYTHDSKDLRKAISSNKVNDLHRDKSGNLWIATSQGLNVLYANSDSIIQLRHQAGLPNEHISSLLEDIDGNIWLGTQNGLSRYSISENSFYHLSKSDGLINGSYFPRSCYSDSDGVLYFGGDMGIDFFDPKEIGINTIPPSVYISDISVNNEQLELDVAPENLTSLSFDYTKKIIEIELLALHLTAPTANTYAYRIPEISSDWIQLDTRRVITLANIRPGRYSIEGRAANADKVWSAPTQLLKLEVTPPYWYTWWFISLAIILGIGTLWLLYNYRTTQIRKQEQIKSKFIKQISELEMKALRAQMNPHFLFNSLNSIKSLISANENAKATEYVTRFSQLIRLVLSNSEKPLVRLQEDLEALRLYLEIEKLRFQNFDYKIKVNENVNADFIEVPPLLLQPYVENAIWHGLMHKTKGHRLLNILVECEGDFLIMRIEDNGIGRDRAQLIKVRGGSRKKGLGMRITEDRIRLLHKVYGQNASVEVEDLFEMQNGSKHGCGTLITIKIPVFE